MIKNFNVKIGVGGSYFTIQICISNDITLWEREQIFIQKSENTIHIKILQVVIDDFLYFTLFLLKHLFYNKNLTNEFSDL